MIHIITLHYATPAWLEIQKRHLLKYTDAEHKVWIAKYKVEIPEDFKIPSHWEWIDLDTVYPSNAKNEHYLQMNWMYENVVGPQMSPDDVLIFLDSDAFPCVEDWTQNILLTLSPDEVSATTRANLLSGMADEHVPLCDVVCLHMPENEPDPLFTRPGYHPYPDLCFFATTKHVMDTHNLRWGLFQLWQQNPGYGMKDRIIAANLKVAEITRSNVFNAHNVMFGVYGNMIYHQQCGSRAIVGRPHETGGAGVNTKRQCYTGFDAYGRVSLARYRHWYPSSNPKDPWNFELACQDIIEVNTAIFDIIYNKLREDKDCTFIKRYFLGHP